MKVIEISVNGTTYYFNVDNGTWDNENKYCACANPEEHYNASESDLGNARAKAIEAGFSESLVSSIELVELPEME
jgi:hypothetical protein